MSGRKILVGEMARISGLTVRTLQYYDDVGIFPASGRTGNGRRYYSEDSLATLEQIVFYTAIGFSLERTKELVQESEATSIGTRLERQKALLLAKTERLRTIMAAIEICQEISAAQVSPPWLHLTRLMKSMTEIDFGYWRDYRFETTAQERLARKFPTFESAMAFYHELDKLLLQASTLKAAGIPFSHVLAQRHGEAWNRFFANRVGDDPELLAVFSLIGQEHDQVNDSRYAGAKEYLAGLFGARREE